MENKPKRSKAIIITIIAIILLLIVGYFIFKNKDSNLGTGTGTNLSKIFSPLVTSSNSKNLSSVNENSNKIVAQAGEDLKAGDNVYFSSGSANNNPVVKKSNRNKRIGFAFGDIRNGELGEIILANNNGSNNFWDSISSFWNDTFNNNGDNGGNDDNGDDNGGGDYNVCENGATNFPLCTTIGGECMNEAVNPPWCTNDGEKCTNGATNFPQCTTIDGLCVNNAINPPDCDNDGTICLNGATNFPDCTNGETCTNGATNFPECTDNFETKYPDLRASSLTPTTVIAGVNTMFYSNISNRGSVSTGETFYNLMQWANSPNPPNPTSALDGEEQNNPPSDDFNYSVDTSKLVPHDLPSSRMKVILAEGSELYKSTYKFINTGTYYIRVCADKKNQADNIGNIGEGDYEDNNCSDWTALTVTNSLPNNLPECSDTLDNDNDNLKDGDDPTCHVGGKITGQYLPNYDSEKNVSTECNDTIDNDGDNNIDEKDPNCHVGGNINKEYLPKYISEKTTPTQCSDTIDNDGDNNIDEKDPNCHGDGNLTSDYLPRHDSETSSLQTPNKCLLIEQNPITFTEAEKAELAQLLRKFYLIAPTLKTEGDVVEVYGEIEQYQTFIDQVDGLINQCYDQTKMLGFINKKDTRPLYNTTEGAENSPSYNSKLRRYGNPWFNYENRDSYLNTTADGQSMDNFQGCSGVIKRGPYKGEKACRNFTDMQNCLWIDGNVERNLTGCEWSNGNSSQYETILNIW